MGGARLGIQVGADCACIKSDYIGQNLEIGGNGLDIWVKISCACIKSTCFGQNIKVGSTGLDIKIEICLSRESTKVYCIYKYYKGGCEKNWVF